MSKNRNKIQDRNKTKDIMQSNIQKSENGKNWLGHSDDSKAACLDTMLLNGTSMTAMKNVRGAINEHIWHLENEHGLTINIINDMYKISRESLGISEEQEQN